MPDEITPEIAEKIWGLTEAEIEELRQKALEKAKNTHHTWRQKGFWLVCKSCENPHASWLGPDKMMVGESEDGTPILVDRKKG